MKKLVLKMMAVCAGALIVSCGSGKNMLSPDFVALDVLKFLLLHYQ